MARARQAGVGLLGAVFEIEPISNSAGMKGRGEILVRRETCSQRSARLTRLALQLHFDWSSDLMGHHDSDLGSWDVGSFDRNGPGVVGVFAS